MSHFAMSLGQAPQVIIWGCRWKRHTHRFAHAAWYWTLKRHGVDVHWVEDWPRNASAVKAGSVVFAVNVASQHLPIKPNVDYVGHNLSETLITEILNSGSRILNLSPWTNQINNPKIVSMGPCLEYDPITNSLYQPWGTPFPQNSWNSNAVVAGGNREFWIGSVWNNSLGQGNAPLISDWEQVLLDYGIKFTKAISGWPDRPQTYSALARRSRLGSAVVGEWQKNNEYASCRVFKNASFGVIPSGNNPVYRRIFGDAAIVHDDLAQLAEATLSLTLLERSRRLEHVQNILKNYTYESGLDRIFNALRLT